MEEVIVVRPAHSSRLVTPSNNLSNKRGRNRNRKVIWFNPPFVNLTTLTLINSSINLLDKHFNKDNPLRKNSNWNTVKISYSCAKNMHSILNNYNRKLLDELNRNSGRPDVASWNWNAHWADDATRRKSYTRCASPSGT